MQAILCAGLYPNVAATEQGISEASLSNFKVSSGKGVPAWFDGKREVHIHNSSINSDSKVFRYPFLVYLEKVCNFSWWELAPNLPFLSYLSLYIMQKCVRRIFLGHCEWYLISLCWWPEISLHFIPLTIALKKVHCFSIAFCVNYASQSGASCKARCLCGSKFIVRVLYAWIVFVYVPMIDYHEYNYYFDLAFCFWKAHFRFKSAEVWWKLSSSVPLSCHSMPWNPCCAV